MPASPVMNRLVFVLSLLGCLVAGYLWWAHATQADMPCGGGHGCSEVAASPFSRLWGVPVAAYGLFGYLLLAGLAFARTLPGDPGQDRGLLSLVVLGGGAGAAVSLYLTYLELFEIRAICRWCVASQLLILAVFCIAAVEWLRGRGQGVPHRRPDEDLR